MFSILLSGGLASVAAQPVASAETQIAHALVPLPQDMREGVRVLGYDDARELVVLRDGQGGMVCVADRPGDDRYSGVCYHESLEPFMTRGRQLRAEGVEGADVLERRHEEMDAGDLSVPTQGAVLYNVTMKLEEFDPETAAPVLYAIYTPYATMESTGLPDKPPAPGGPWLMRMGTPSAHIMIIVPKGDADSKDGH